MFSAAQWLQGCNKVFLPWQPCENKGHSDPVQSSSSPSSPSPSKPHYHHPGSSAHAVHQHESQSEEREKIEECGGEKAKGGNVANRKIHCKLDAACKKDSILGWTGELCLHCTSFNSESGGVVALITHSDENQMIRNK